VITYLYWLIVLAVSFGACYLLARANYRAAALGSLIVILLAGWMAHVFYFEQVFVKRYGGVMTITVPDGQRHITATWKEDNLWVENYDPDTNTCFFSEYSRGNLLQGRVLIRNCTPLGD
jgi:hypothetical protein